LALPLGLPRGVLVTNRQGEPQTAAEAWDALVCGFAEALKPIILWVGRHPYAFVAFVLLYLFGVVLWEAFA
jgi:hypothetical protein